MPTEAPTKDELDRDESLSDDDKATIRAANATADSDDLGEQGGKTIEDMAGEGGQQTLLDFGDTLSLTVRGKKPTDSTVKIKAISTPVKGQLGDVGDDETIVGVTTAMLEKIEFVTKRADRKVIGKERRHVLDPVGFVPFRGKWAARLEDLVTEMLAEQDAGDA